MTAPAILVLNGPNLNLLGQREPHIYGTTTLAEIEAMCRAAARGPLEFIQANRTGDMIEAIQVAYGTVRGLVINPAACTFTSSAVPEALAAFDGPVIEIHLSNIHARGPVYANSLVSPVATAVIAGLGARGYPLAVEAMYSLMER